MKFLNLPFRSFIFFIFLLTLAGCGAGRTPVPDDYIPNPGPVTVEEEQQGHNYLNEISNQYELTYDHPKHDMLLDIVDKLTHAAGVDKDPWHIYVLKDDNLVNAGATKGNHIFVWTGMLNKVQSETDIATVMSHELAHILARHTDPTSEEVFSQVLTQLGARVAGVAAAGAVGAGYAQIVGSLTENFTNMIAKGFLVNPYSRELEHEADKVGILIMAEAGYDPRKAVDFWERSKKEEIFSSTTEFLSTHPVAENRIEQIREVLPYAIRRYENKKKGIKSKKSFSSLLQNKLKLIS